MAKRVQLVRHDNTGAAAFTGRIGEVTVNTSNNSLIVHDGVVAGGFEQARADLTNVVNASAASAGKMSVTHVAELTTATADIATNAAAIAVNVTDIATNVTDIGTINGLLPTGTIVGTTDTQTLSNKTFAGDVAIYDNDTGNVPQLVIEQDGTGDAALKFLLTATQDWTIGIDNSASDAFKISNANVLGTSDYLTISTAGVVTMGSVAITGGSISGITDLAVADGGTGASSASVARTNLGLAIGSNVQAYDADLAAIAALANTNSNFIVGNGSAWVAESGATARASLGLGSIAVLSTVNDGNWSGTDLAIVNGGTGNSTASAAFAALKQAASVTVTGVVELATQAEVNTGTDANRAVTPATLAGSTNLVTGGNSHDHSGGDGAQIPQGGIANEAIGKAQIKATGGTVSLAGSVLANGTIAITLTAYSFFPMIHTTTAWQELDIGSGPLNFIHISGHGTDGANPDLPRFALKHVGSNSETYDVDYRYIPA